MRTHLDLFSGIGGFSLAAHWAGFETVAFCEIDPYAQRVLKKNFGAVMADSDGKRLEGSEYERERERVVQRSEHSNPVVFSDIRSLDGAQFRGVTLLTAGVPCQPASTAGKRRGSKDVRWLWPEALRILRESAPDWAVFENPPGILSLDDGVEFERVLSEVESAGYTVQPIIVPACAVDARHRRDRVWIVANASGRRLGGQGGREIQQPWRTETERGSETVAHADHSGPQGQHGEELRERGGQCAPRPGGSHCTWQSEDYWFAQSGMGRVASGIPSRVDRLRCLGNSIVPQVAFQILNLITSTPSHP